MIEASKMRLMEHSAPNGETRSDNKVLVGKYEQMGSLGIKT
jgi:hypothetical protein